LICNLLFLAVHPCTVLSAFDQRLLERCGHGCQVRCPHAVPVRSG